VNKAHNISNRSSVLVLPMYICTLPILCEHEQLSAIVEWTQSDHSDGRHWMEGMSTTKLATDRVVLFQHLRTGQKIANWLKVTGYWKNATTVITGHWHTHL